MIHLVVLLVATACCLSSKGQVLNGFNVKGALIPVDEIMRGGPPRDGIPSIDDPVFEQTSRYREYGDDSPVLGVNFNGVAKAYPIRIMDWHEVVNDEFDGVPVVVTYCPLCGSGMAFEADVTGTANHQFGVSGLLYNSDVLLYDRATNSLWSQIMGQAISGPLKGTELTLITTQRTSLGTWKELHPDSWTLTTQTGYHRNYQSSPYGNYDREDRIYFPVAHNDNTLYSKEWVIGVEYKGGFKAYPVKRLSKIKRQQLIDVVGGEKLTITWDKKVEHVVIKNEAGKEIIGTQMFWFAWAAFHPQTEVFK